MRTINATFVAIILVAVSLFSVSNVEAAGRIYYTGYGYVNASDDSTLVNWRAEIDTAKAANDSRYKVWTNFTNDWCDVREYIAVDANIGKDIQGRWNDGNVGRTISIMREYATERRNAVAAVQASIERQRAALDRQDEIFLSLAADTASSDTNVVNFRNAYAAFRQQINLAEGTRRSELIHAFRETWKPLTDGLAARIDERAAKQALLADLQGIVVTVDDLNNAVTGLQSQINDINRWINGANTRMDEYDRTMANQAWVNEHFKRK